MITHALITQAVAIAEKRAQRPGASVYSGRAMVMIERALFAAKSSNWLIIVSGFVEPVLYLMAFGFGIGQLIGDIQDGNGNPVSYAAYIAPALLATSAMNGALYDATWNVFFKMHFGKVYQVMLSSSLGPMDVALGEISWALLRGATYSVGFMAIVAPLGLVANAWGLLAIPAATLIAFGFASIGMAITSSTEGELIAARVRADNLFRILQGHIHANPLPVDCRLDPERVRLYNAGRRPSASAD